MYKLIDLKKFLIIRMQDTNLICPELVKYTKKEFSGFKPQVRQRLHWTLYTSGWMGILFLLILGGATGAGVEFFIGLLYWA